MLNTIELLEMILVRLNLQQLLRIQLIARCDRILPRLISNPGLKTT
jgi:hypothetical protein